MHVLGACWELRQSDADSLSAQPPICAIVTNMGQTKVAVQGSDWCLLVAGLAS